MPVPLPASINGPKLKAFEGDLKGIQFERFLGSDDELSSGEVRRGEVRHGLVFKVRIGGKTFALKVFNFFSLDEIWPEVFGKDHLLTDNVVRHQLDPFYAECRAFGLLVEKNQDDELAVRCYGYVFLSEAIEHQIESQFGIRGWNRKTEDDGSQLRAIVKDYIRWKTLRHRRTFAAMREKLQKLNKLGIYNMDIREANYLGGRLFDFSIAITFPHISLWSKLCSAERIMRDQDNDIDRFDSMVKRVAKKEKKEEKEKKKKKESKQRRPVTRSQSRKILLAGI
ncbi:kinetochore Sim4 complex subunit FTA2-domain-containing protein [Nemania sp. FL0031]|nr:kinetochore Sim4 complex subunit FTA2-domain-containing protein [Nemania sp. FL0031]